VTLVPEWTDITRGLPFFLGKLLANSSENTRTPETMDYVDAMPKPDNEYCFQEDRDLTLPISFSGFQTPVLYIDTLTDVTTRFKTISTPQLSSQPFLHSVQGNDFGQDACTGGNFLFALWYAIKAIRVINETIERRNFPPYCLKVEGPGPGYDVQAHAVVQSLAYLCLLSGWERPINYSSARHQSA
jgi:hypothetical protein